MKAQPEDEVQVEEVALKFTLVADKLHLMFQDTNGQLRSIFPYNGVFPRLIPRNYDNCDKFVVVGFAYGLARSTCRSGTDKWSKFGYELLLFMENITITFYSLEILIFN